MILMVVERKVEPRDVLSSIQEIDTLSEYWCTSLDSVSTRSTLRLRLMRLFRLLTSLPVSSSFSSALVSPVRMKRCLENLSDAFYWRCCLRKSYSSCYILIGVPPGPRYLEVLSAFDFKLHFKNTNTYIQYIQYIQYIKYIKYIKHIQYIQYIKHKYIH